MRCVVVREHGSYERLLHEERPDPEPGPGEARIAVRAVGLNHLDLWVRGGIPGVKFPLPIIPGCDAAGVCEWPRSASAGGTGCSTARSAGESAC
jgi:NADPH2:quinone reductase